MKLIIDISEELYAKVPYLINKGNVFIGDVLDAVENGTPLEAQSNRCDSCKHLETRPFGTCVNCKYSYYDNWEEVGR